MPKEARAKEARGSAAGASEPARGRTRLRWASLAVSLSFGAALILVAGLNYLAVREAHEALVMGHARIFFEAVRVRVGPGRAPPSHELLESILEEHRPLGLRYLVLLDPESGRPVAEAGDATMRGIPPAGSPGGLLDRNGSRLRLAPPPPPPEADALPRLVIEVEPLLAERLESRALLSLITAIIAVLVLGLVAFLLWRQLRRADAEEEKMAERRHLESLGVMSAVLAHEIKNPLASLKGNAQLLQELIPEDDKRHARAARVVNEATRLEGLTKSLLQFAKSGEVRRSQIDPRTLLREAAEAVHEGIQVDDKGAPELWSLDPVRMRQVVENILRNAVQADPKAELPKASLRVEHGSLVFRVRDHGPGIPKGREAALFQTFQTDKIHGTGLGLAVARRIVELHGGTIHASNHPGGGAIFSVAIPEEKP